MCYFIFDFKKEKTMYKNITKIALKGIAMAMGVAVIVMSTLKTLAFSYARGVASFAGA
jgi:tRNA A37 threonylcarbamoyladenosine modification protein TsaB